MILFSDLFNERTLNIFTDASIYVHNSGTISCPGVLCVITNEDKVDILEKDCGEKNLIFGSTNNEGEISAINLGIYYAMKYKSKFENFNLFSDSNICIQGLNDWIFKWFKTIDENGIMRSSTGKPVANQSIISDIYNTIIEQSIPIKLYHQKGHVKLNSPASLESAYHDFKTTNNLRQKIDMDIIKCISFYNDIVDADTKTTLEEFISKNNGPFLDTQKPLVFIPKVEQQNEYKRLIKKEW